MTGPDGAESAIGGLGGGLVGGLEGECDRVDAVAVARGRAVAVGEHVPEVGAAVGAAHLDPLHPAGGVLDVLHSVGHRLVEARPAAAGVELRVGLEELRPARLAGVHARGLGVGVLPDERSLGAGLAQHGVLLGRELLAPLLVGLLHLVGHGPSLPRRTSADETERTLDTRSVTRCYILTEPREEADVDAARAAAHPSLAARAVGAGPPGGLPAHHTAP